MAIFPAQYGGVRVGIGVFVAAALFLGALLEPEAGLHALILTMPLREFGRVVPGFDITFYSVAAVAGLIGTLAVAWRRREAFAGRGKPWLLGAMLTPWAAALISTPFSLRVPRSLRFSWRFLWHWATSLFVWMQVTTRPKLRRALTTFVLMGSGLSVLVIFQSLLPFASSGRTQVSTDIRGIDVVRPAGFYVDPNFLAVLLCATGLAAAAIAVSSRGWRRALPWAGASALSLAGMALTLSRTALVSLIVGAVVIALTAPRGRRLLVAGVLIGVLVLGVIAVPSSLSRVASLGDAASEPSLRTRVLMAKSMVRMLPDYWLTGTGLASFEYAYKAYRYPGALTRVVRPHQVPLALWIEMGVAGLLAGLSVVAGLVWALRRRVALGWRPEDSAVLAALTVMLVGSLFQYFYYFEPFWFVLALTAALPHASDEPASLGD